MPQTNTPNNQTSIQKNLQSFMGHFPIVANGVYVHDSATIIGHVNLGENVSVWPGAVIRGDINFIKIGAGSNIQDCAVLHVNHQSISDPNGAPLIIGENVTIGHTVILHGCTIKDESLIGMGSIVMDKAIVQKTRVSSGGQPCARGQSA